MRQLVGAVAEKRSLAYLKTQPDLIIPGLSTYLQPGSQYRHARVCWRGRTLTRTTGTSDKELARKRALVFFADCLIALRSEGSAVGISSAAESRSRRFNRISDDWLREKRGTICEREWRNLRNILTAPNGPARFFASMDVGDITTDKLRQYLQSAEAKSTTGKLSPHTLKRHLSLISGILKLAVERQLISAVPPMPRVRIKDQPRPWFTPDEYKILLRTARRLAAEKQGKGSADGS